MLVRRLALALVVLVGCEGIREAWEVGKRLSERCSPGIAEEEHAPLTDAKITSTLAVMDAFIAAKRTGMPAGTPDEAMVALLEAGGMGCGQQVMAWGKVRRAIEQLRERRGLPALEESSHRLGGLDSSRASEALTAADVELVDARFDEVDAALQRYLAAGKSASKKN